MLGLLAYVGRLLGFGKFYFVGLAAALMLIIMQYQLIKKRLKTDCFKAFLHNNWIGLVIFLGLVLQYYLPH